MSRVEISERRIFLDDLAIETRVLDAGEGPPVVLLHGNPDNADEWRPLIERIARRHRCIAPDFPGYARTPEPPASFSYSVADQVKFLDALLAATGVDEPLLLVVHDIGGILGVPWAAANTQRLRGLLVTNTVAFEGFQWFPIARRWGRADFVGRLRAGLGMRALELAGGALFVKVFGAQNPQLDQADLRRFVETFALNRAAKNTTLRQFRQIMKPDFFKGFDDMLARVVEQAPCRVLWGDDDPYLPKRFAEKFGHAPVTVLPHVGHWVPLVAPDRLTEEVAAFG